MTKYLNKATKPVMGAILAVSLISGSAFAATAYETKGQYAGNPYNSATVQKEWNANTAAASAVTASGGANGVICDLNDPYFYENYHDQVYDLSYCDWN